MGAATLRHRAKSIVAGHGCEIVVEIRLLLQLFQLPDPHQMRVVDHAAVFADLAPVCDKSSTGALRHQIFCRAGIGLEPGCSRHRRGLSSAKSLRRFLP